MFRKENFINKLVNDYGEYLEQLSKADLKFIIKWNVYTYREARELEEEYNKKENNMKNKTIKILQHNISYYYENNQEMPEYEQEHIKEMIIEGYSSGELNDGNENRGWWDIIKKEK